MENEQHVHNTDIAWNLYLGLVKLRFHIHTALLKIRFWLQYIQNSENLNLTHTRTHTHTLYMKYLYSMYHATAQHHTN